MDADGIPLFTGVMRTGIFCTWISILDDPGWGDTVIFPGESCGDTVIFLGEACGDITIKAGGGDGCGDIAIFLGDDWEIQDILLVEGVGEPHSILDFWLVGV